MPIHSICDFAQIGASPTKAGRSWSPWATSRPSDVVIVAPKSRPSLTTGECAQRMILAPISFTVFSKACRKTENVSGSSWSARDSDTNDHVPHLVYLGLRSGRQDHGRVHRLEHGRPGQRRPSREAAPVVDRGRDPAAVVEVHLPHLPLWTLRGEL